MFLLDASQSIQNHRFASKVLEFVVAMSDHFDFAGNGPDGHGPSRLAVTTFSRPAGGVIEIPLDSGFHRGQFIDSVRRDVEYSGGLTFVTAALHDVADHFQNRSSDYAALGNDEREKVIVNVLDGVFTGALPNQFFGGSDPTSSWGNEDAVVAAVRRVRAAGIIQYAIRLPALNLPSGVDPRLLIRAAQIMTYDPRENITNGNYYWSASSDTDFDNLAATVARRICQRATTEGACRPTTAPSPAPTLSPTTVACPPGMYVARPEVQTRLRMRELVTTNGTSARRLNECPVCLQCRYQTCPENTQQVGSCGVGPHADEDPGESECNDAADWTFCRNMVCAGHCVESSAFTLLAERNCQRSCGLCTGNNGQTCAPP